MNPPFTTGTYLLDASAVLAYTANEPGAEVVAELLKSADKGRCRLLIPFMAIQEVLGQIWILEGEDAALFLYSQMIHLPTEMVGVDNHLLWLTGEMRALYSLLPAEAWVLATAKRYEATLVHKDPEFERFRDQVRLLPLLPYPSS